MKKKIKAKSVFVNFIIGILFMVCMLTIISILNLGFLSFLGFTHNSIRSVVIFFVIYNIMARIVSTVLESLKKVIKLVKNLTPLKYRIFDFMVEVPSNIILVGIADFMVKGVNIPIQTAFLFALLSYALEQYISDYLDNKKVEESAL